MDITYILTEAVKISLKIYLYAYLQQRQNRRMTLQRKISCWILVAGRKMKLMALLQVCTFISLESHEGDLMNGSYWQARNVL